MNDQEIISLYWMRSEKAISETACKYGKYCYSIAFRILADHSDSEECVSDTYLKAWDSIPPRRPTVLSAFLGKITRNLAISRYRYFSADKRGQRETAIALEELSDCIPDTRSVEGAIEKKELTITLRRFLETLPKSERSMFLSRYWFSASVKEIAEKYGYSESKVKTSLFRTRRKLQSFLEKEGVL